MGLIQGLIKLDAPRRLEPKTRPVHQPSPSRYAVIPAQAGIQSQLTSAWFDLTRHPVSPKATPGVEFTLILVPIRAGV